MSTVPRSAPAPRGLARRGRALWKSVVSSYQLRPDELILLETACRTLDLVVDLEAAMVDQPLLTKGSMGQEREHPLLSELRLQRGTLAKTLGALDLPDPTTGEINQHRAAAQKRWKHGS